MSFLIFRLYQRATSLPCVFKRDPNLLWRQIAKSYSIKKEYHKPNIFEKYMLVWMKKYPSVSEVPSTVSNDIMEKTRNWARIKINIIFCILTAIGCVAMVYSGKQAAKRGESLHKMNIQWHKEQDGKK